MSLIGDVLSQLFRHYPFSLQRVLQLKQSREHLGLYLHTWYSSNEQQCSYRNYSSELHVTNDLLSGSAVVVMRRSSTASCRGGLTVNRVLLGQSTWDACSLYIVKADKVNFWWKLGPFIMAPVNHGPARNKKTTTALKRVYWLWWHMLY